MSALSQIKADRNLVAHDFAQAASGRLPADKLDAAVHAILAAAQKIPATGNLVGAIFYVKPQVTVTNGKTFNGNGGGIFTPGGGALFGDVYTDDLNRLYAKTVSFQITSTPVYCSIVFFDSDSNALGSFQSGGISTVTGTGGGSGSWS
jgi:hypothetical protein